MNTRKLSLVVGWIGGIYGILRGGLIAFQPIYMTASSVAQPPQIDGYSGPTSSPPIQSTPPTPIYADPVIAVVIIAVMVLVFGGVLALLTLRKTEAFSLYAFTLFVFSLLSLPSIGWIFLPATALLLLSAVLATPKR